MGAPSAGDAADASAEGRPAFRWVEGYAKPHRSAGATPDGTLPRVNDGAGARDEDDTKRNAWLDGGQSRLRVDLGRVSEVVRVCTYSRHPNTRAPQRFVLWGASTQEAPPAEGADLAEAGWQRIAEVDTWPLGIGGNVA